MAEQVGALRGYAAVGEVTQQAFAGLDVLFRPSGSPRVVTALRSVQRDLPSDLVEAKLAGYIRELPRRQGAAS